VKQNNGGGGGDDERGERPRHPLVPGNEGEPRQREGEGMGKRMPLQPKLKYKVYSIF